MPRTTTPPAGQEKLVGPEGRVERSERILPYDRIHLFDVHRLLVGEVQWSFLAEVFDRGVLTCVILVAIIWLMGTGSFFLLKLIKSSYRIFPVDDTSRKRLPSPARLPPNAPLGAFTGARKEDSSTTAEGETPIIQGGV
jgi:hypothetical protein